MNSRENTNINSSAHSKNCSLFVKNSKSIRQDDMEAVLEVLGSPATVYKHPTEKWITIKADTHMEAKRIWRELDGHYAFMVFPSVHNDDIIVMTWKNIKPRGQMKNKKKKKKTSTVLPLEHHQEEEKVEEVEDEEAKSLYDLEFPPLS